MMKESRGGKQKLGAKGCGKKNTLIRERTERE